MSSGIVTVSATTSTILMKKLYGLVYDWVVEEESHGLASEEAHRQVQIVTDYPDFVWKHKAGKGP